MTGTCRLLLLLAALALSPTCAALSSDVAGDVAYADDAKANYDLGVRTSESGRHLEAVKYFEYVRNKYPYSTFAALAELAMADSNFEREKYIEAIDGYRGFVKLHPRHPQADYAQFRIGLSHYKEIPSDFILFPPSSEKDQTPVHNALITLEEFLRLYPESKYAAEAKGLVADVRKRMADHEMYVANFYLHRERYKAAEGRLQTLVSDFKGLGYDGEALIKLGKVYIALKEPAKARETLEKLLKDYPQDSHRAEAERLLRNLG